MFRKTIAFNQRLNNWDTSSVIYMSSIFSRAAKFNKPLLGVTLSTRKYSALLRSWSKQSPFDGMKFHGGNSTYSPRAVKVREFLTHTFYWQITDDGLAQ